MVILVHIIPVSKLLNAENECVKQLLEAVDFEDWLLSILSAISKREKLNKQLGYRWLALFMKINKFSSNIFNYFLFFIKFQISLWNFCPWNFL